MTTFNKIFAIALAFVASAELCAKQNESGPNSDLKKRFSVEVFPLYDFESLGLNLNIAVNNKWSVGVTLSRPESIDRDIPLTALVDYYFNSFDTDSWFLRPHVSTAREPSKENDGNRIFALGLDYGYRSNIVDNFVVRPTIASFYAPCSGEMIVLPFVQVGFTW